MRLRFVDVRPMSSVASIHRLRLEPARAPRLLARIVAGELVLSGIFETIRRLNYLVRRVQVPGVRVGDFSAFLNGWHLARYQPSGLYSAAAQAASIHSATGVAWSKQDFPLFVNPPQVALFGWPLGGTALVPAFFTLLFLSTICALVTVGGSIRYLAPQHTGHGQKAAEARDTPPSDAGVVRGSRFASRIDRILVVGAIATTPAVMHVAYIGALTFFVAVGAVAVFYSVSSPGSAAAKSGVVSPWVGAFGLLLISSKPQYVLFCFAALLGLRCWDIIVRGGALLILSVLASSLVLGWDTWPRFFSLLSGYATNDGQNGLTVRYMVNVRGILTRLIGGGSVANSLATAFFAIALLGVAFAAHLVYKSRTDRRAHLVVLALAVALSVFASPHTNVQDVLVAIPAFIIALRYAPRSFAVATGVSGVWLLVRGPLPDMPSTALSVVTLVCALIATVKSQISKKIRS